MNKSKILRAVLTAVLTLVATTASAHDFEVDGIYYKYNGDGTVSVTFKGSYSDSYVDEYTGDVVIPSSVTYSETTYSVNSIGDRAFEVCRGLTSVTIPNSVTSIGDKAFEDCSGLTRVDISSLEAWLGIKFANSSSNPLDYARHLYLNGEEVKDLVIPNSVTSIGDYAFYGCSGLTSVTIPNSVTSIGDYAFQVCSGLTSVTIPNSVTYIGSAAFYGCRSLTRVDISSIEAWLGIKFSNYDANPLCYAHLYLNGEEVKDLVIPNSVTSIGKWAFAYCSGLTTVTIPNTVTTIGEWAFSNCRNLTSVTIPNSVTSIGEASFENCINLASITIPNSVTSINNCVFAGCRGLTTVTIPNTVTTIGEWAFSDCRNLTSVTIPNSVKKISNYAFCDCSGLTSVTIGNSVNTIGEWAFHCCSSLNSIIIGKSVNYIGDLAFYDYDDKCSASIIIKAVTPPSCGQNLFSSKTYKNPIIVPSIAKEAYQAASVWGGFSNYAEPDNKITAIEFESSKMKVEYGETLQLTAKVTPEDATFADVLQWESSNPEVATVDDEGLVTTLALGSTVITATSCDYSNISATCTVVVCQKAANVNELVEGANNVGFGLQGVKMHDGVLYACTTAESVNMSTPTLHGNNANNMAPYEDRNFADFDQRDWVAISGLEGDFEGKELRYPFVANFADGVLTPSETITATADATAYTLNTFRAENILHGGYSNYAEGDYTAYYVPARVNEVAKFMGLIETIGGVKYLYSNNAYGRKDGEGIKVENCTIEDNSKVYSLLEGILVADASTKACVKIIMLKDLGQATGVEGVDSAAARIYTANGCIIIAATEDGEAAVYDFTGRLIKSVPVVAGDSTAVPVMPGCYIVKTETKTQSVVVK